MKPVRLSLCLLALTLLGAGCFGQSPSVPSAQNPSDAQVDQAAQDTPTAGSPAANGSSTDAAAKAAPPTAAPKTVKKPAPSQPAAVSVLIGDTSFSPGIQVVQAGGKVVWTNKGSKNQTVHSTDSNLYDSGNIPPGKSWSHVFPAVGSYLYYSASDLNMKGTIIVR